MLLPIEIWQIILDYSDIKCQILLRQINTDFRKLKIYDLLNIPQNYAKRLCDEILCQYPDLKFLSADNNPKITNVNHMTNLKYLIAAGPSCGITDNGIQKINLKKLDCSGNRHFNHINHMSNLRSLNASHFYRGFLMFCAVSDQNVTNLNLKKLMVSGNYGITNINHMINLQYLDASQHCGIGDEGIQKNVNLIKMHVGKNSSITNVNHLTKLEILYAMSGSAIDNAGIKNIYLKILDSRGNPRITNVDHMSKIEIFKCECHRLRVVDDK